MSVFAFFGFAMLAACGGSGRVDSTDGAALFVANCTVCHGGNAQGGGGAGVPGLSKTPPDLTRLTARNGGTFPVFDTAAILEGYAQGGLRGRQMAGFTQLQSDRKRRVRIDRVRVRTSPQVGGLLRYLDSVQRP